MDDILDVNKMSTPKGGGTFKGLDSEADILLFNGEGCVKIPIELPPCRDFSPELNLLYHSNAGNGVFGMGFTLDVPEIRRQTRKNIPKYDDEDIFVMSGVGELSLSSQYTDSRGRHIKLYMARYEQDFNKIEYITDGSQSYWAVVDKANTRSLYGVTSDSLVTNPQKGDKVFAWMISEALDEKGSKITYSYNSSNFIDTIRYGNYMHNAEERFAFTIAFCYSNTRMDVIRRYDSGFLIETDMLCTKLQIAHNVEQVDHIVRELAFHYNPKSELSMLERVTVKGYRKNGAELAEMALPDMHFSFTPFAPESGIYGRLDIENNASVSFQDNRFSFVDLYGEGVAGLLYTDGTQAFYCTALGEYRYASPSPLENFPLHRDLSDKSLSIQSLEGNGRYQLVSASHGFYELQDGAWDGFTPFQTAANECLGSYVEFADLQGDRLAHMLFVKNGRITYYPSLKKNGVGRPVENALPVDFPLVTHNTPHEKVLFLDLFGDGLPHRVRIKNGCVECYPNLGYGRFGEKIAVENAPYIQDGLDVSRLFFADIDGTGTTDFIYAYPDRVAVYKNLNGLRFSEPFFIELPEPYTDLDRIAFGDLNGTGTSCMIFSKHSFEAKHYCYDFCRGTKPYMLCATDNNRGRRSEFIYKSAVSHYLSDRKANIPWAIKPPFPVQLIAQKTDIDSIAGNTTKTTYTYRDGLYDYEENYFRGFGFIEILKEKANSNVPQGLPALRTKHWFYVGIDASMDYYRGDKQAGTMEPHIVEATNRTLGEKSLWGKSIRTETYAGSCAAPMEVVEYNYRAVELLQPQNGNPGSYHVHRLQTLRHLYEADCTDPMVEHLFNLQVDAFGNIEKSCTVNYPRRKNPALCAAISAQQQLRVTLTETRYINRTGTARHLGVVTQVRDYETGGVTCQGYFRLADLNAQLDEAGKDPLPYGSAFSQDRKQVMLRTWKRRFYWNDSMTAPLPWGEMGRLPLAHHEESAVFPVNHPILDRFERESVEKSCGYHLSDGYYWNESKTVEYFDRSCFYLPRAQLHNRVFCKLLVDYDPYCLLPVKMTSYVNSAIKNTVEAEIDYTAIAYRQIIDQNGNTSQVDFNPLGQVVVSTSYGVTEGRRVGDSDVRRYTQKPATFLKVLEAPGDYLQGQSSFYYWDLDAYSREQNPVCCVSLTRTAFMGPDIAITVTYYDAGGRECAKKHKLEASKWIDSDRIVFDSDGNPLLKYMPSFTSSPDFHCQSASPPVRYFYDYAGRVIGTQTPDTGAGLFEHACYYSKSTYSPWENTFSDENSCLKDSRYYKEFLRNYPQNPTQPQSDKMDALQKSVVFEGSSLVSALDNRRNIIAHITEDGTVLARYGYDSNDRLLYVSDGRQAERGAYNLRNYYDMGGKIILCESCDGGGSAALYDVHGNEAVSINANGARKRTTYDGAMRIRQITIDGVGVVERRVYGEEAEDSKNKNLRGKLYRHYDQAGVKTFDLYDIDGCINRQSRQLCREFRNEINWDAAINMEPQTFTEEFTYDRQGHIIRHKLPHEAAYRYHRDLRGNLIRVDEISGAAVRPLISEMRYEASAARAGIAYANGVEANYFYNSANARLERVVVTGRDGGPLQHLRYTYDPVGGISSIRDLVSKPLVTGSHIVAPLWDYRYDRFHRLVSAAGREHAGHQNDMESLSAYTRTYCYDAGGNLTRLRHAGANNGFTVHLDIDQGSNRILKAGTEALPFAMDYDSCGNTKKLPGLRKMTWNYDNRLVRATVIERDGADCDGELYVYDSNGERVRKVTVRKVGGGTEIREKIYIGGGCVERVQREQGESRICRTQTRIREGDAVFATVYESPAETRGARCKTLFHTQNHTGSIGMELDESGGVVACEEFYPYGGTAVFRGARPKEYRFCAKELDATGLYYFGARYYWPQYGVMISPDNVGYINAEDWQTINLYAYCKNNPICRTDPTGSEDVYFFADVLIGSTISVETSIRAFLDGYENMTMKTVYIDESFSNEWQAMKGVMAVINAHGQPGTTTGIDYGALDTPKALDILIYLSCNAATAPADGRSSVTATIMARFPKIRYVIGANDEVNVTYSQSTYSLTNIKVGSDDDDSKKFFMYSRDDHGGIVTTPLGKSYRSFEALVDDIERYVAPSQAADAIEQDAA